MQWHSVNDFLAMGGYASYVWGSVGLCALAMVLEPWLLHRRHRQLVDMLRRRAEPATPAVRQVVAVRRQAA